MRQVKTFITTYDTGKEYVFPCEGEDNPHLWEVKIKLREVDDTGGIGSFEYEIPGGLIFVERQTLVDFGALPYTPKIDIGPPEPKQTVEDLILQLLEAVGCHPAQ